MRAGTFTHGIRATYARGICRKGREDGCPGHPETGISCREAWRISRRIKERERRARLKAEREAAGWIDGRTYEARVRNGRSTV
jgi:hypothetical protein